MAYDEGLAFPGICRGFHKVKGEVHRGRGRVRASGEWSATSDEGSA